jgi:hypothetical protein
MKKARHLTQDGLPVHSFETLMMEFGTRCRNRCQVNSAPEAGTVDILTELTPLQKRALELLGL